MGMITNIKSLQGMGIYADRGARSPSLQFRRFNLVYGFNGSGKSTLSRVFASLEAGAPHPKLPNGGSFEVAMEDGSAFGCPTSPAGLEQRLLVFNSDYIEKNLQWSAGRANPVFYIGADQAEAAADLTRIEGEIVKAEANKEVAAAAERAADKTFANFKRERAKSVASRLHLGSRKYEAPALAKDYETWKDDQGAPLTDDELKAAEDTRRLDEPMPPPRPGVVRQSDNRNGLPLHRRRVRPVAGAGRSRRGAAPSRHAALAQARARISREERGRRLHPLRQSDCPGTTGAAGRRTG